MYWKLAGWYHKGIKQMFWVYDDLVAREGDCGMINQTF